MWQLKHSLLVGLSAFLFWFAPVFAADLDAILAGMRPEGVVIELAERDAQALGRLLPKVQQAVEALRGRFPELPIQIVTHGREMFILRQEKISEPLIQSLRGLRQQEVPIAVCGTHAEMKRVDAADFVAEVEVVPHGPNLIRDLRELGYAHLRIR